MKTKKQKNMKITTIIFMFVVITVILFVTKVLTLEGIKNALEIVGSDWLTKNNTGLLAICGVEWWHNHSLLVFFQIFVLLLGLGSVYAFFWAIFIILELVAIISYLALTKSFPGLEEFEELGFNNILSVLIFKEHPILLRRKTPFSSVLLIFGAHILFFFLTPLSIICWLVLWCIPTLFIHK